MLDVLGSIPADQLVGVLRGWGARADPAAGRDELLVALFREISPPSRRARLRTVQAAELPAFERHVLRGSLRELGEWLDDKAPVAVLEQKLRSLLVGKEGVAARMGMARETHLSGYVQEFRAHSTRRRLSIAGGAFILAFLGVVALNTTVGVFAFLHSMVTLLPDSFGPAASTGTRLSALSGAAGTMATRHWFLTVSFGGWPLLTAALVPLLESRRAARQRRLLSLLLFAAARREEGLGGHAHRGEGEQLAQRIDSIERLLREDRGELARLAQRAEQVESLARQGFAATQEALADLRTATPASRTHEELLDRLSRVTAEEVGEQISKQPARVSDLERTIGDAGVQLDALDERSRSFLLTGMYLLLELPPYIEDFSPAALEFARALELELHSRVFDVLRDEWRAEVSEQVDEPRREDMRLRRFLTEEARSITLGEMAVSLSRLSSRTCRKRSALLQRVVELAAVGFPNPSLVTEKRGLAAVVTREAVQSFRNDPAHTRRLGQAEALAAWEWAAGGLRLLDELVQPVA